MNIFSYTAYVRLYCSPFILEYKIPINTYLCLTVCEPMDCGPLGFSVHEIFQARILEWVAIPFSRDLYIHCLNCSKGEVMQSSILKLGLWNLNQFSSVQSLSCVRLFATQWIAALQASLSITNSRSLHKLMPIESVMPSSHLILCHPLLLLSPVSPSIRVCSNESTLCMRWPKYWSFSFSISPSDKHPELISFRMDCLYLLAVQGILKSLLQHHRSKASIFWHSAFSQSNSHIHTWSLEKPWPWLDGPLLAK